MRYRKNAVKFKWLCSPAHPKSSTARSFPVGENWSEQAPVYCGFIWNLQAGCQTKKLTEKSEHQVQLSDGPLTPQELEEAEKNWVKVPLRWNDCFEFVAFSESLSGTYSPVQAVLSSKCGKMDFFCGFPESFLSAIIESYSCNPVRPCCFVTSYT